MVRHRIRPVIRPAEPVDLPRIRELHIDSWRSAYEGLLPATYLHRDAARDLTAFWNDPPTGLCLTAWMRRDLAGFILVLPGENRLIDALHVTPKLKGAGIGGKLLRTAARDMLREGARAAHLWAIEGNTNAIAVYQRMGGHVTERVAHEIFGHPTPSLRIDFTDLEALAFGQ